MDVRKKNAKDLRKAWIQFLKEQSKKNGREKRIGSVKGGTERWNNDQLHTAFDFCDRKCAETHNDWWLYLRETVLQEITDRGGRR